MIDLDNFTLLDSSGTSQPVAAGEVSGVAFIHIGKTGGTSLKDYAKDVFAKTGKGRLLVINHAARLAPIVRAFPDLKFACFIRDPAARSLSAFNSRMRCGRPRYNSGWSVQEAVAFSFFENEKAFIDALCGQDERLKSAAQFAMASISHLRRGYVHHFKSPEFIENNAQRFAFVGDHEQFDRDFSAMCDVLGLPLPDETDIAVPHAHKAPEGIHSKVSDEQCAALKDILSDEYAIYDTLKSLNVIAHQDHKQILQQGLTHEHS